MGRILAGLLVAAKLHCYDILLNSGGKSEAHLMQQDDFRRRMPLPLVDLDETGAGGGGGGGHIGAPSGHGGINYEEVKTLALFQLIYSLGGLVVGMVCVLGGIVLFLHGVTGSTSWTAKFIGASSKITDAAPGAVLFVVGLFIIFVTRFTIKHRK